MILQALYFLAMIDVGIIGVRMMTGKEEEDDAGSKTNLTHTSGKNTTGTRYNSPMWCLKIHRCLIIDY